MKAYLNTQQAQASASAPLEYTAGKKTLPFKLDSTIVSSSSSKSTTTSSYFSLAWEWITWPFTSLYSGIKWLCCCCPKEEVKIDIFKAMEDDQEAFVKEYKSDPPQVVGKLMDSLLEDPAKFVSFLAKNPETYKALVDNAPDELSTEFETLVDMLANGLKNQKTLGLLKGPLLTFAQHFAAKLENPKFSAGALEATKTRVKLMHTLFSTTIPKFCEDNADKPEVFAPLATQLGLDLVSVLGKDTTKKTTGDVVYNAMGVFVFENIVLPLCKGNNAKEKENAPEALAFKELFIDDLRSKLPLQDFSMERGELADAVTSQLATTFFSAIVKGLFDKCKEETVYLKRFLEKLRSALENGEQGAILAKQLVPALIASQKLGTPKGK